MIELERHADPLDEAAALANSMAESAIAEARRANLPETHPDFDGESCVDCWNTIPLGRLALGKVRCVYCQEKLEHLKKQQGRPGWSPTAWPEDV